MKKIDGMLQEFETGATRVESSLSEMLALVSGGRVPKQDDVKALERDIDGLQQAYLSIQQFASQVVDGKDMPEAEASVHEYAEAIKQSELAGIQAQLQVIEARLRRFISVKALMLSFEDALKPYQEEAKGILAQLRSEPMPSPEEMEKNTESHKLFLQAMDDEDLSSEAGMELMEALDAHYPAKI